MPVNADYDSMSTLDACSNTPAPHDGDTTSSPHEDFPSLDAPLEFSEEPSMSDDEDCEFLKELNCWPTSPVEQDVPHASLASIEAPCLPSISDNEKHVTITPNSEENAIEAYKKGLLSKLEDNKMRIKDNAIMVKEAKEALAQGPRRSSRLEEKKTKRAWEGGGGDEEATGEVCARLSGSAGQLEKHMLSHNKRFKCTVCVKTFPQKANMQAHVTAAHKKIAR